METDKTKNNSNNEFFNLQIRDGIVWVDASEKADTFAYNVTRWMSEDMNPANWMFCVIYKDALGSKERKIEISDFSVQDGFITVDEEPVVLGDLVRVELFHNGALIRTLD